MATPSSGEDTQTKSKSETEKKTEDGIDDELSELLDSALADFGSENKNDTETSTESAGAEGASKDTKKQTNKNKMSASGDPISDLFAEEFSEEMSKQFEEAMKSFMGEDPAMMAQIEKLAEAAEQSGDSAGAQQEFQDTLKQTLSSLAQNTEGLQDHQVSDEDVMHMFSGLSAPGGGEDGFMPMMQSMMKTLLSKDVLYPSLKEISDKYPAWLETNKSKVKESEFRNYSQQHDIITQILTEFESEKSTDTDDCKKQRFERIMDLMQKMQDLGQPPKEIVGDMAPGLEFDANGMPKLPGAPEGCSIM